MGAEVKSHPVIESWLKDHGVNEWQLLYIDIDQIDLKLSAGNQARAVAFDQHMVDAYTAQVVAGTVFPPVVVARHGKRLVIIDGNHRVRAHVGAKVGKIDAYVIDVTEAKRAELTMAANATNGAPPSELDRTRHIVHMWERFGDIYSAKDIAVKLGTTTGTVERAVKAAQVRQRATGNAALKMPDKILAPLARIPNDLVLSKIVDKLHAAPNATIKDVGEVVATVVKARTEATQLAAVDEGMAKLAAAAPIAERPKRPPSTAVTRLSQACGTILNLSPSVIGAQANGSAADLREKIKATVDHIRSIEREL